MNDESERYGRTIELALGEECLFCRRFVTHHFIVARQQLLPICGRCSEQLQEALRVPVMEDKRR